MLAKLWNGDYSLAVSYWLFGAVGSWTFAILFVVFMPAVNKPLPVEGMVFLGGLAALWLSYCVIATVGIWKSDGKASAFWGFMARLAIVFGIARVLAASIRLVVGG